MPSASLFLLVARWVGISVAAVTLLDNGVADLRVSEQQDGKGLGLQHYGCAVSTLDL